MPTEFSFLDILTNPVVLVVALVLGGVVLRFVFRLAARVLAMGCAALVILALLGLAWTYFG